MKRNPSVELMRIFACLIVLACHCNLLMAGSDYDSFYRHFITGILSDGVAIFWMITGFFITKSSDYKKLWRRTLTKIIIPVILLYIVDLFLADFLLGKCTFTVSLSGGVDNILNYIISIIHFEPPNNTMGHTWYVFAYIIIILITPVLKSFALYISEDKRRQILFLTLSGAIFVLNDILMNQFAEFTFHGAGVIIPSAILIMWGYIIYLNKELLTRKIFIPLYPIIFVAVNLVRTYLMTLIDSDTGNLFVWYTSFGIINAVTVIAFCLSVVKSSEPTRNHRFICFIAGTTYGIYLIHPLIQETAKSLGVFDFLYESMTSVMPEPAYYVIALLITTLGSFIICLIIILLLKLLGKLIPRK